MVHTQINAATSTKVDATLAYFTQAKRPVKPAAAPVVPEQAALDLMFGYYDQH